MSATSDTVADILRQLREYIAAMRNKGDMHFVICGQEKAAKLLYEYSYSDDLETVAQALWCIGTIFVDQEIPGALYRRVLSFSDSSYAELRRCVAHTLGHVAAGRQEMAKGLDTICRLCADDDETVRCAAAYSLGRTGQKNRRAKKIVKKIKDGNENMLAHMMSGRRSIHAEELRWN